MTTIRPIRKTRRHLSINMTMSISVALLAVLVVLTAIW